MIGTLSLRSSCGLFFGLLLPFVSRLHLLLSMPLLRLRPSDIIGSLLRYPWVLLPLLHIRLFVPRAWLFL